MTLFLMLLLLITSCRKPSEQKHIVFLFPHPLLGQTWHSFLDAAQREFSDTTRYKLHFYQTAGVSIPFFEKPVYEPDVTRFLRNALIRIRNHKVKPDLLVLYGDYICHNSALVDDPMFKETPILCLGVTHPEYRGILSGMPNVVVAESEPAVRENLDFIRELGFPHYVVTVMDSTYVDDHIREHIIRQMGDDTLRYRPNLFLEQEDRIRSLANRQPQTTLFPVSTMHPENRNWHTAHTGRFSLSSALSTDRQNTSYLNLKDDPYAGAAMNYNIGHFFTMTPEHFNLPMINAMNMCLGGYLTPFPSMFRQIRHTVDRLLSGEDPGDVPWIKLEKDYWLDWRVAKKIHPYASDFPKGIRFVNISWMERSRLNTWSMYVLSFLAILAIVVFAFIVPLSMAISQRIQRKRLVERAKEAEKSKAQVADILSELNVYLWRMLPDLTLRFSSSFYRDFNIPEGDLDVEHLLSFVREPGRSDIRDLLFKEGFKGDRDVQALLDLPGNTEPRAILIHTISIDPKLYEGSSEVALKAGIMHFNDKAYKRNQELRQAYRRSEEVAEKERFLMSMSTDFQAPMDKVIVYAQILSNQFRHLNEEQKESYGREVEVGCEHLIRLLDDVMGSAKGGKDDHRQLERIRVADLMEEVYSNSSIAAPDVNSFEFRRGPASVEILTSGPDFVQVMDAIVSDALAASDGHVAIGWRYDPGSAGREVVIFIENASPDISAWRGSLEALGCLPALFKSAESPTVLEIAFHAK